MKLKRILSLLLALVMTMSLITLPSFAADDDTVTVTVNYVYDSNKAMVAQPWSGQFAAGEFQRTLNIPMVENYHVDTAKSVIPSGVNLVGTELTFDTNLTSDLTVTLYYVAGTATYTVNHYQQNLDNDEYTLIMAQTKVEGNIDAYTNAVAQIYPGFTCTGVEQKYVVANNSTVVDIYYDRDYYKVVFDVNGGVNAPDPVYGKFGSDLKVSQEPSRAGYNFDGWSLTPDGDKVTLPDTLTEDVTYYARWTPKSATAKVTYVIWGQNANDDDYSFKGTVTSLEAVDSTASWYKLTCGKEAHSHAESGCTVNCVHTHDLTCYGLSSNKKSTTPDTTAQKYFEQLGLESGKVYRYYDNHWIGSDTYYYLDLDGKYYEVSASICGQELGSISWRDDNWNTDQATKYDAKISCTHTIHDDACYSCGLAEHTHDESCYEFVMKNYAPDSRPDLWKFKESTEARVDAAGNTVVDVYYDRTEFTITFQDKTTVYTIQERWGRDITSHWPVKGTNGKTYNNGERWKPSGSKTYSKVLVRIAKMPEESFTLTVDSGSGKDNYVMRYNVEVLPGESGTTYNGKRFTTLFTVNAKYSYVTEAEDFFPLEGFTKWQSEPKFSRGQITTSPVDFYYTRNSYNLYFYSSKIDAPDRTESVKYQANLGSYNKYLPTQKPEGVESDAIFAGWYLNPQCTGAEYILSDHIMPANNVALYAKWVNRSYTVKTFTDDSLKTLYTYDGYTGSQTVEKYKTGTEPTDPTKEGYAFVGWFYKENGVEKAFDFSMPVTKDYNLYPKFSDRVMLDYTVHYYVEGTTNKVASDTTATTMIGNTVSLKAKMGIDLDLAEVNNYFPMETSKAVRITERGQEVIFYYKEATDMTYTVKYQDEQGNTLAPDKTVTTQLSVVTEQYVSVENYTPREFQKTLELSADTEKNVIVFVYTANKYTITYDANGGTLAGAGQVKYTVNDAITLAAAPTLEGYNFTGWKLDADAGNWTAGNYTAQQDVAAGKYGDVTLVAQWQEKTATIKYEVVGPTRCGTVTPANETVKVVTGPAIGSTAAVTSNDYKFVGWYSDPECKNPVPAAQVAGNKFTPAKDAASGLYVPATYYAKFEWNVADLTITKKAAQGTTIDNGQSFIFHVTGKAGTITADVDMYVTVQGEGSVTVKGLKVGSYKVEEVTTWSWRYTPDGDAKRTVSVQGGQINEEIFQNTRTNPYWLSGDSYAVNIDGMDPRGTFVSGN